jgi:hypothetical protein
MKSFGAVTALAVAILAGGTDRVALGQASPPEEKGSSRTGMPPMDVPPVNGDSKDQAMRAPVLRITSVEIMRSTHAPYMDIIRVRGLASSSGWEEAELVPLTRGIPADGVLQLIFVARAPTEATEANGFEAVEAIFPLETSHPFKGVNVHSASESVTVNSLPGYAEGKGGGEDCNKCVGKFYVAKGAGTSSKAAAEIVREEQLPPGTRVIKPSDGIPTAESNPNRLTLIVNKEGKIVTAVWE